jgi:uncharacterized protein (TIGR02246 family)
MRAWIASTIAGLALVAACNPDRKGRTMPWSDEQEALFKELDDFTAAWSRGDAKGTASFFTEDGVRVGAAGDTQHGRAELEAAYDRLFHDPFTGATVTQDRGSVRMLTNDLALWQGGITIQPPAGAPAIKGYVVPLMKKVDGRWLVLEAHPKIYPPPRP